MQELAGVRARGEDRVVAARARVAERRALLGVAVHLADEGVDVDDQARLTGAGTGLPRARERLAEHAVELAHVPERERAQERPQRRGRRHPAAQQPARAPRAQQVAVIDRVGAQRHRVDERHHLAPRVARAGPIGAQAHAASDQPLDAQPPSERRGQRDSRVGDQALVVEVHLHVVQSGRPVIVHHEGDLLMPGPGCPHSRRKPCSGGHSSSCVGRNRSTDAVDSG